MTSLAVLTMTSPLLFASGAPAVEESEGITYKENLETPKVPSKAVNAITRHLDKLAAAFKKAGFETARMRNNEILKVYVPCDTIFAPNSTVARPEASAILSHFKPLLARPESYKLLMVAYTDDSGDTTYSERFTEARSMAVDSVFEEITGTENPNAHPYFMGKNAPRTNNKSIKNRRLNRRVEVIIVPDKKLIEDASGKRLN